MSTTKQDPANPTKDKPATEKKLPLIHKLIVGGAAGIVGTTAIFPLDMVKTRSQSSSKLYSSPFHATRVIFTQEGVRGFYRGLIPNLVGVTPEKAIKLAANDVFREYFEKPDGTVAFHHELLAGAGAGACQVVATTPMELIKIRMQMQKTLPVEQQQSTLQVVRSLGIRGAYTGMTATLIRDVPFSIVFFPLYANLKPVFADSNGQNSLGSLLGAGGLAGAAGSFVVTPMDVVKTRLQEASGAKLYKSIPDCFAKIYKQEGIGAFFKGAVPRMCVVAPLFGISLVAFEKQKEYLIKSGRL